MSEVFDPYVQWLGIRDPQRPPNHYRLLGVELFEPDADVLTHAADRQMSHVRTFQAGRHSAVSQRLLNEIAAAKVCLLNPQKKAEYDARLRWDAARVETAAAAPTRSDREESSAAMSLVTAGLGAVILVLVGLIVYVAYKPHSRNVASTEDPNEIGRPVPAQRPGVPPAKAQPRASPVANPPLNVPAAKAEAPPSGTPPEPTPGKASALSKSEPSGATGVAQAKPAATTDGGNTPPAKPETPAKPELGKPEPGKSETPAKPDMPPKPEAVAKPPAAQDSTAGKSAGPSGGSAPTGPPSAAQSLAAARQAMRARDRVAAGESFKAARRLAKPEEGDAIKQFQVVWDYWDWFWKAFGKGFAALKAGQTLDVGDKKVEIVGVAGEELTVRQDSQEKKYGRQEVPFDLAAVISLQWIPDGNAAMLAKAAALCFEPTSSGAEIRKLVETAAARGLSGTEILTELSATPAGVALAAQDAKRLPVPDDAAQQAKLAEIQGALKKEYDKLFDKRQQLASTLFQQGLDARDDPTTRFVCYREALEQAVEQGDAGLIDKIAQALAGTFEVDPLAVKIASIRQVAKRVRTGGSVSTIARQALAASAEALQADKFDEAAGLVDLSLSLAKRVVDRQAIKEAVAQQRDITAARQLYDGFIRGKKVLADKPDDPQASLAVGEYFSFVKNDWAQGAPLLLKGSDDELKNLAAAEKTPPTEPAEMLKLADRWWLAAKTLEPALQRWAQLRAAAWYKKAQPNLDGPAKARVEQRLKDLGQPVKK